MLRRPIACLIAAILLALSWFAWPVAADQRDERLDQLFTRLKTTSDPREAKAVEQIIWHLWMDSDDATVRQLMRDGVTAMSRQQYDVALERFNRIVQHAPDFAEGWNKRATVYYLIGNYPSSVLDIERTLQLEPRHFGALSGLGLIYDAIGRPAAALRSFEAALAINPHLSGARRRVQELRRQLRGRPT